MKTLLLFLFLPFFARSQDTLPAILKVQQGNWTKPPVKGYVVLTKDCKVVEYLRVNTWRRKEKILPFPKKFKVVDYFLIKSTK